MEEISNKTLAALIVVAILISLAGTFFAMRGTPASGQTITGFQSSPDETGGAAAVQDRVAVDDVLYQETSCSDAMIVLVVGLFILVLLLVILNIFLVLRRKKAISEENADDRR